MRRREVLSATAGGAFALLVAGCGSTETAAGRPGGGRGGTTLRLALNQNEDHPSYVALENFADRLGKATDGRWNVDVFPNENLGAQQEALQLTSDGTVDLAIVSGIQLESLNEDFVVFNLPYVFDSIDHQMKVVRDEEITRGLYTSLEESEHVTVLGGFTQGARSVYAAEPVTGPADLAGMKVRVQESRVQSRMLELMGGSATPMSYGEVYTALQSGVLDGAENNEISYLTQKHYEVAAVFSRTEHLIGLDYLVMNTDRLTSMSGRDRAALDEAWAATMTEFTRLWKSGTKKAVEDLKKAGVRFHTADREAFRTALSPLAEEALPGEEARRIFDRTRAAAL